MITLVVAMADNGIIGKDGDLPWHLPDDLKHFKAVTLGKPVIMGRRTWAEVGRPLPGRRNIVISRQADFEASGADVVNSLQAALDLVADQDEVMVIGGGQIYREALPLADQIWRTRVHADVAGDTRFPDTDWDVWSVAEASSHAADERHAYAMTFERLVRAQG